MIDYNKYLYVTVTGRNDWTSTIPTERNSFFYPGVSTSFIFSDAFPALGNFMTGKLRAAYAEVGKDARPYAYRPSLEYKTTSYGGYGYGFTGPNLDLKPEFARSYEFGTELGFLDDRLGIDATVYRKQTKDQIVNDIRGSYATGFILFNLNGAETRNTGRRADAARERRFCGKTSPGISRRTTRRRKEGCSRCRTRCRSRTSPTRGCTATCATAPRRACPRCR